MLAEAAANTVQPPINPNSAAVKAAAAAGLDVQLLYDYRCGRSSNISSTHRGC